jgi:predicted signal transduction protein with EAL and GGDEF domain
MAVVAVTLAINFMPLSAQAQETINSPTKNVLLLGNGIFGSENYTSQNLALNDYDGTIDFISEDFSTSQSLIDSTYKETFYNYLKNKIDFYGKYDGVIASSDIVLSFVMDYVDQEDSIFYEIPILFNGIGDVDYAEECALHPWVDGIPKYVDMEKLIELASDLSPYANSVYYIYDDNLTGNYYKGLVENELEENYQFDEDNIIPICSQNYTFDELGTLVSTINKQDITIFLNCSKDSTGTVYNSLEIGELLEDYFNAIVITSALNVVGTIATGGYFIDLFDVYENEFAMLDTYFNSSLSFENIELDKNVSFNYIFDQDKLDEFDIYNIYLPSDSIIYNETLSFQELYPTAFVIIICFVVLFVLTSIVLISLNLTQIDKTKKTKKLTMQIKEDVRLDKTTKLPGKYAFNQDIDQMIQEGKTFALAVINVDDFDRISDYFGEQRKKVLIVVVSNYIRNLISKRIKLYVYSEDEMLLLFPLNEHEELAEYVLSLKNSRRIKYKMNDVDLDITWTTGYAIYPENGTTRNELITNANFALEYAKSKTKGSGLIFSPGKVMPFKRISELNELFKYSVQNRLLENKYSPIVNLQTGKYDKLEVTVHVKGLNIPFEECINIANSTSLIRDFEKRSIEMGVEFIKENQKNSNKGIKLLIKIPTVEINDVHLRNFFREIFLEQNISLKNVICQIDESFVNIDTKSKEDFLSFVKSMGMGLCMENFGEGYSSINSLYDIDLEMVKFSSSISDDTFMKNRNITAKSFCDYMHSLGLKVCITNIDSLEKAEFYKGAGFDFAEGSYFDYSLSESDMLDNLIKNKNYKNHIDFLRLKEKGE